MKCLYLNLTATMPHIGCLAVTYAHLKFLNNLKLDVVSYDAIELKKYWQGSRKDSMDYISKSDISVEIASSDLIVINCEGTIHHNKGNHLLSLAEFSININKAVFLLNLTLDSLQINFDDVFAKCSDIVTREIFTYKHLINKNIECRLALDDFAKAEFSSTISRNLTNSTVFTDWHPNVEEIAIPMFQKIKSFTNNVHFYPFVSSEYESTWKNVVANFETASLIVCGRYHAIYAAALASKPFIILPMNSHKAESLINFSKIKIPICRKKSHIENVFNYSKNNPQIFNEFSLWMKETYHDNSFRKIEKFVKNNVNNDLREEVSFNFENIEKKSVNTYYDNLYKKLLKESENRIVKSTRLLQEYNYCEFLSRNPIDYIQNEKSNLDYFIAFYASGNYEKAEVFFKKLDYKNKVCFKAIVNFKLELGQLNEIKFDELIDNEIFSNEWFLKLIDQHKFIEAWNMLIKRNTSHKLIQNDKHLLNSYQNLSTVIFILEGGIGDQIRQSKLLFEIYKKYENIIINCDNRIHFVLLENFKNLKFINRDELDKSEYKQCPILDYYIMASPFTVNKKNLLPNESLKKYWFDKINFISNGKLKIGICQGSHIRSYERLSNRFDYELWLELIEKYIDKAIFINLSFDYEKEINLIKKINMDLKNDIDNLSALISNLDFVITPANTVLDIAGVLGIKTVALFTGYKFRARQDSFGKDLYHDNVLWKGSFKINDKNTSLKYAFDYIFENK